MMSSNKYPLWSSHLGILTFASYGMFLWSPLILLHIILSEILINIRNSITILTPVLVWYNYELSWASSGIFGYRNGDQSQYAVDMATFRGVRVQQYIVNHSAKSGTKLRTVILQKIGYRNWKFPDYSHPDADPDPILDPLSLFMLVHKMPLSPI